MPGRKKQIGIDNSPSNCSIMECCVSKFDRVACAPMCGFRRRRTLFRREAEQHSGLKPNTIGA